MHQLQVACPNDAVFVDKLGARCAAKRTGVSLYGGLLAKHDCRGSFSGGPTRADLARIRVQEQAHYDLLVEILGERGADPGLVTPSARLESRAAEAVAAVVNDPDTGLAEGLEATLVAEIIDREGWVRLIELAESRRQLELAEYFQGALDIEVEHLRALRRWIAASQGR